MLHVFVETNWVFGLAAPAHHKDLAAVELLERARRGELRLHLPSLCLTEVRNPLRAKCQTRNEADAIRDFLKLTPDSLSLTAEEYATVNQARLWVYGDLNLTTPPRPAGWPPSPSPQPLEGSSI